MSVDDVLQQVREERFKLMQLQARQAAQWAGLDKTKIDIKAKKDYISKLVALAETMSKEGD
jgi:hypothetical protein